ncbi:amino acid ABC transporter permease [Ancylobacter mangrovi]|uniref:amino acid ABC transporter permease n=1 Tax=Ancylobacter mangrovi TaxID=2972472 RepID=UPI002161A408|nr:amino acid ABC transporter permease [Ancylobacter mangrovi]MCS0505112.1 amino acid ABC transporter permease [Ancylobacter mangrovi]
MTFDPAFLLQALPRLLPAALLTVEIALAATLLGLLGGTALTILRACKWRPVNAAVAVLMSVVIGTPLLVQIFVFYYVLPAVGIDLGPMSAGILALSLNSAVFVSEMMRGGLATLSPGAIEAAVALGLRPAAIWLRVVLPQLYAAILPSLIGEFTILVKATALLSVITVVELFRTGQQIYAGNFRPFETLSAVALLYVAINASVSLGAALVERRLAARRV